MLQKIDQEWSKQTHHDDEDIHTGDEVGFELFHILRRLDDFVENEAVAGQVGADDDEDDEEKIDDSDDEEEEEEDDGKGKDDDEPQDDDDDDVKKNKSQAHSTAAHVFVFPPLFKKEDDPEKVCGWVMVGM